MKHYIKYIATVLLYLLVGFGTAYAQEEPEIDYSRIDTTGFDARKYLNQKRFIPQNETFIKKKSWHDHMYVDLAGGVQWFDNTEGSRRLKNGFLGTAYWGVDLTSVHGVRLGLGMNRFTDGTSKKDFKNFEVRADYLCNFSSLLNGYDPKRWLDISTVTGLSYYRCMLDDLNDNALGVNLGLQFLIKAGSNTGVTIEPMMAIVNDGFDLKHNNNRHGTNLTYGLKIGLKYIFTDANLSWPKDTARYLLKNTFVETGIGANMSLDAIVGTGKSVGSKYTVAMGKWFTPGIGVRLGVTAAENRWKASVTSVDISNPNDEQKIKKKYRREELQTHTGLRFEAMLNPLGFGDPELYTRYGRWQFNLSFGGELGWMMKGDHDDDGNHQNLKCDYMGLTAGAQFLCQVERDVAFFVEPRYTLLNYDIPYENRPDLSEEYNDNLFSISAGIRMCAPTMESRLKRVELIRLFEKGFFAEAEMGMCNFLQLRRFEDAGVKVGLAGSVAAGYRISPYLNAKARLGLAKVSMSNLYDYNEYVELPTGERYPFTYNGLWERNLSMMSLAALLEVNLSNLFMGYDIGRYFDLKFSAGPSLIGVMGSSDKLYARENPIGSVSEIVGNSPKDATVGFEVGATIAANISEKLQVYLAPRANFFSRKLIEADSDTGMSSWPGLFSTSIGVSYSF